MDNLVLIDFKQDTERSECVTIILDGPLHKTCPQITHLGNKFARQCKLFQSWYSEMIEYIDRIPFLIPWEFATTLRSCIVHKKKSKMESKSESINIREVSTDNQQVHTPIAAAVPYSALKRNENFDIYDLLAMDNREFILKEVMINSSIYKYASQRIKKDREITKLALSQDGSLFEHVPRELRYEREIVKLALESYGDALLKTRREFRMDKELALMSLNHTPKAVDYFIWENEDDYIWILRELFNRYSHEQLNHIKLNISQISKLMEDYPFVIRMASDISEISNPDFIRKFLSHRRDNFTWINDYELVYLVIEDMDLMLTLLNNDDFILKFQSMLMNYYWIKDKNIFHAILKRIPSSCLSVERERKFHLEEWYKDVIFLSYLPLRDQQQILLRLSERRFSMFPSSQIQGLLVPLRNWLGMFPKTVIQTMPLPSKTGLQEIFQIKYPDLVVPYSMFTFNKDYFKSSIESVFYKLCYSLDDGWSCSSVNNINNTSIGDVLSSDDNSDDDSSDDEVK